MAKFFCALLCFFCSQSLFGEYLVTDDPNNPVVEQFTCVTMPKAGTHLLTKLLYLIAEELEVKDQGDGGLFYQIHTMENSPHKLSRRLKLVLIRDPRDALLSSVEWVDTQYEKGQLSHWFRTHWPYMTFKEKVHTLIFPVVPEHLDVFECINMLPYYRDPANLVVRFEDLVGERGGESHEAQIRTINQILDYVNIHFDQEKIEEFSNKLWGGTNTFNKGVIGRWVDFLDDEEIKEWVNYRLGEVIEEFGYAEKENW